MADQPTVGLDAAWVAANAAVEGRRPDRAEFVGFIGTGQMSRNARFRLDWAGDPGPASVVVKVPSAEPGTRAVSFEHDIYRNECEFYRSVTGLVDISTARCLAVHFDAAGGDFAIVLEDLVGSEQGDQFTEPSHDQLELAISQAAALHAPVWGDTARPELAAYRRDAVERAARADEMMPFFHAVVLERLGDGLEPDVAALLERFVANAGRWTRHSLVPTTLVHGDFRPDNFMFGVQPDAPPLVVVDWQTLSAGRATTDVAYLLGASVEVDRRREIERGLLEHYIDELAARGADLTLDEALADYATGSLHGVVVALTATTMADQTERGDALFTLMLNRHGRHALDFEALDHLPR